MIKFVQNQTVEWYQCHYYYREFFDINCLEGKIYICACVSMTYPDFDGWTVCNAQPVTVWREAQCIDAVIMVQGVQMFAIVQVPQQGFGIFTARCAQWTVWRNGYSVQVTVVSFVVDLKFAIGQIPDLDGTIPTAWHNNWIAVIWRETDARYPIGMTFILNCVLAFGKSVPQFDGLVPWTGDNLTIVNAECNRQHILQWRIEWKGKTKD